jgi:hypothetical protein
VDQRTRWEIGVAVCGVALSVSGGGATVTGYVNPALGWTLVTVGAVAFLGAVLFMCWPWLNRIRLGRSQRLSVEASVEDLAYAYPLQWPGALLDAGFRKRGFATLRVRNVWKRDLHRIVARCTLAGSDIEVPCFWAKEQDGKFAPGGGPSADLGVWHTRVLLIAQVFGAEKLWARLPAEPSDIFHTGGSRDKALAERIGEARVTSRAGESLDLKNKVDLVVRFRAEGLSQEDAFRLSFDAEGPAISRLNS